MVISIVCVVGSAALALIGGTPLFNWFNVIFDPVFWPIGGPDAAIIAYRAWVFAILGGTMAGWGTIMLFVVNYPFRARELWAWNALATSTTIWFILDTSMSLYYRVYPNVIFNVSLFVILMLPIVMTRTEFSRESGAI